jgi:hypothetical protein
MNIWGVRLVHVDQLSIQAMERAESSLLLKSMQFWLNRTRNVNENLGMVRIVDRQHTLIKCFHYWLDRAVHRSLQSQFSPVLKEQQLVTRELYWWNQRKIGAVFRYWKSKVAKWKAAELGVISRSWKHWRQLYTRAAFDTARRMLFAESWYEKQCQKRFLRVMLRKVGRFQSKSILGLNSSLAKITDNLGSHYTLIRINPSIK